MIPMFDYGLVDWICFLTFNIGKPAVEAVLTGTRILIGLLRAKSVRNVRFRVVPLAVATPVVEYVSLRAYPRTNADITQGFVPRRDVYRNLPNRIEVRLRSFIENSLHVHHRLTRTMRDQ